MTSMPLDTAALHMAEPTKPLPPKTTIYKESHLHNNVSAKSIQEWII